MPTLNRRPALAETLGFCRAAGVTIPYIAISRRSPLLLSNEKAEVHAVSVSYLQLCPSFRPRPRQWQWNVSEPRVVQAAGKRANFSSISHESRELLYVAKSQSQQTVLYSDHHRDRLAAA
jgi:hypothetical protein